jgi:uncharacterized membrane protein
MYSLVKSRTFWTIVLSFVVGGLNQVLPILPPGVATLATFFLGIAATYFHVNPSQNYTDK